MVRALLAGALLCAPIVSLAQPTVVFQVDAQIQMGSTTRTFTSGTDDAFSWSDQVYAAPRYETGKGYVNHEMSLSASGGQLTIERYAINNYVHTRQSPTISQQSDDSVTAKAFVRGAPGTPFAFSIQDESFSNTSNPVGTGSATLLSAAPGEFSFGVGKNNHFVQGVSGSETLTFMGEQYSAVEVDLSSMADTSYDVNAGMQAPYTAANRVFGRSII
jgi:hypothetical protein